MPIIDIIIVLEYVIILILCIIKVFHVDDAISPNQILYHRLIFISITIILIFMLLSRLLGFNVFFTETGRTLARFDGWYKDRRIIQFMFVIGAFIFSLLLLTLMERNLDSIWRCYSKTFYGITFLICFIVIITVSYHPVDQLLKKEIVGIKYNRIIEFLTVTWIVITLLYNYRRSHYKTKEFRLAQGSKFI
jgi:hypothetical protein